MVHLWHRAARLGSAVGLAAVLAACGGGVAASPAPPASPVASGLSASPDPLSTTLPSATATPSTPAPSPTATALLPEPPAASLAGLVGGGTAAGSLGSFTWAGGGSDAPWIVGTRAGSVGVGRPLRLTFGGPVQPTWTAAWAKVVHGTAESPVGGAAGVGDGSVTAPAAGGDWTLGVTATFGPGANATYFWRLAVTP